MTIATVYGGFRLFILRERALRDAAGKAGQQVGYSPSISPSALKELERLLADADRLALLLAEAHLKPVGQALDALEFAQGAIVDAIGLEDGLDGAAGAAVIRLIRDALEANGRALTPLPDDTTEAMHDSFTERLYALLAALPETSAPQEDQKNDDENDQSRGRILR